MRLWVRAKEEENSQKEKLGVFYKNILEKQHI